MSGVDVSSNTTKKLFCFWLSLCYMCVDFFSNTTKALFCFWLRLCYLSGVDFSSNTTKTLFCFRLSHWSTVFFFFNVMAIISFWLKNEYEASNETHNLQTSKITFIFTIFPLSSFTRFQNSETSPPSDLWNEHHFQQNTLISGNLENTPTIMLFILFLIFPLINLKKKPILNNT